MRTLSWRDQRVALIGAGIAAVVLAVLALNAFASTSSSTGTVHVTKLTFGAIDTFQRSDSGRLGRADSSQPWNAVSGTWAVDRGHAYLASALVNQNNVAVLDTHTGDGAVQVTMASVLDGAGLVFRYRNPLNFWMLVARPRVATWTLQLVQNGILSSVAGLGLSALEPGTTIGVRLQGAEIAVSIDGQVHRVVTNGALQTQTWAGLIGFGAGARYAQWTDFVAVGSASPFTPPPPLPKPASQRGR